jgi:hypothetical protein
MESPTGLVVGYRVVEPDQVEGAVGRALLSALEEPLAGAKRRPDRIRVADAKLAAEVRAAVRDEFPIEIAPTPELDDLLETMLASIPPSDAEESYLSKGRIAPKLVADLFFAAKMLFRLKPWTFVAESQVIRMDIPALDVEGACLSVIGGLEENFGVLILPSLSGFEALRRSAESVRSGRRAVDVGTGWLALSFERGADLPTSMRREVATHGWPVASAEAYPVVQRFHRDGVRHPLVERDVRIASACAAAIGAFLVKHRSLFEADEAEPVSESYFDDDDLEVRFTAPYDAFPLFDIAEPERARPARVRPKVARNAPCPCGSGRKYKKCHLPLDEADRERAEEQSRSRALDERMVRKLFKFAAEHFGDRIGAVERVFKDVDEASQLAIPWLLYAFRVDGRTVLEAFIEARGNRTSEAERAWLEAQRTAWLSVWEVTAVVPGESVSLHDLLSGETRVVRESGISKSVVKRDALLARVRDREGVSLLDGLYPRPLPPIVAAEVVRRARGRLRRTGAIPVERLRDEAFGRYLIRRWENAVAALDRRASIRPVLANTDGDPLLLTTDHFEIAPGEAAAVERLLAGIPGVEPPEAGEDPPVYAFLRPESEAQAGQELTLVGEARVSGAALRLDTNSVKRADALRERVEATCQARIRHRAREHADPLSSKAPPAKRDEARPSPPPEAREFVLEYKRRYYADWIDQPVPALGGKTPRQAARSKSGRTAVDVLLKDMEHLEQRLTDGTAFDFSGIRRELGVD